MKKNRGYRMSADQYDWIIVGWAFLFDDSPVSTSDVPGVLLPIEFTWINAISLESVRKSNTTPDRAVCPQVLVVSAQKKKEITEQLCKRVFTVQSGCADTPTTIISRFTNDVKHIRSIYSFDYALRRNVCSKIKRETLHNIRTRATRVGTTHIF